MTISFFCSSCGAVRRAANALVGRQVRCPECDSIVLVPAASNAPEAESESTESAAEELVVIAMVEADPKVIVAPGGYADVAQRPLPRNAPKPVPKPADDDGAEDTFSSKKQMNRDDTEMDMTPMVDVVFQLLIFFMLTAAFALQKSKEIPKPEEQTDQPSTNVVVQESSDNPDLVTVKVDSQNTYRVLTVDWDEEAPNEHELFVKLRRAKQGDAAGRVPTKMRIEIHEEAFQDKLIAALDGATSVEINDIQIMTVSVDE